VSLNESTKKKKQETPKLMNLIALIFTSCVHSSLEELRPDSNTDVIGIIHSIGDATTINTKAGKELMKRELQIVDDSSQTVKLTLWGEQANNFNHPLHSLIAVKAAKISDFDGR
jgi:replication factor A1